MSFSDTLIIASRWILFLSLSSGVVIWSWPWTDFPQRVWVTLPSCPCWRSSAVGLRSPSSPGQVAWRSLSVLASKCFIIPVSLLLCHGCHSVSVSLKNLNASLDAEKKPGLRQPCHTHEGGPTPLESSLKAFSWRHPARGFIYRCYLYRVWIRVRMFEYVYRCLINKSFPQTRVW